MSTRYVRVVLAIAFLAAVWVPAATADIIYDTAVRDISTSGSASYDVENNTFNVSDAAPSLIGSWSSSLNESVAAGPIGGAVDFLSWSVGHAGQDSSIGASGFSGSGSLDVIAGTAAGSLDGASAHAQGMSEFKLDFTLTAATLASFSASHSVYESGAAAPLGVIQLQGPGIDIAINNDTLDLFDILLLPGAYHFEAWVSGFADDLPGEYGGESSVVGNYQFSLTLGVIPEPMSVLILGLGAAAMAVRKRFSKDF